MGAEGNRFTEAPPSPPLPRPLLTFNLFVSAEPVHGSRPLDCWSGSTFGGALAPSPDLCLECLRTEPRPVSGGALTPSLRREGGRRNESHRLAAGFV